MTKTRFTKILSVLLCLALVVAIALTVVGCTKKNEEPSTTAAPVTQAASAADRKSVV